MTDLRCLTVQEAEALLGAEPVVVRDRARTYWRLAPEGAWSAWRNEGWQPDDAPATLLEGPAELATTLERIVPAPSPAQPAAPAPVGPAEYLAQIETLRARYQRGEVDSGEVEASLGRFHLVDDEGAAWTVGFGSRAWFRFAAGRWVESGGEPDAGRLLSVADLLGACPACGASTVGRRFCGDCGAEQRAARLTQTAAAGIADFLERGYGTLPEPVTAPWDPPEALSAEVAASVAAAELAPTQAAASMAPPPPLASPAPPAPVSASASTPAPAVKRGSRRARLRRLWSIFSLAVGLGLLVFSLGRAALALTRPAASPPASPPAPAASVAVVPTPGATVSPSASAEATASPSVGPTAAPTPGPTPIPTVTPTVVPAPTAAPTPTGELVFADQFDTAGAWPTGPTEWTAAAYLDGRYQVTVEPVDLPVAIWPVAEASVGRAAIVEASLVFAEGPGSTEAGLIVEDADQLTHLVFVVSPDGSWSLFQDDMETFRTFLQGKSARLGPGSSIDLRLELRDGMVGVSIDGEGVGVAGQPFEVARFGLALRATEGPGTVAFDDFVVSRPAP